MSNTATTIRVPWHTKAWAWIKAHWYVPLSVLALLLAWLLARLVDRSGPGAGIIHESGIDRVLAKSKDKADASIRAAQLRTEAEIQEVERNHAVAVHQLEELQRQEYEEVRAAGPKAAERWLNNELNRRGL